MLLLVICWTFARIEHGGSLEGHCDGFVVASVKPPGRDTFAPNSMCLLFQIRPLRMI